MYGTVPYRTVFAVYNATFTHIFTSATTPFVTFVVVVALALVAVIVVIVDVIFVVIAHVCMCVRVQIDR